MTAAAKFIVWDWNGTLQDDFHVSIAAANQALQAFGKQPVDADTYRDCFDIPIDRMYRNLGLSEEETLCCIATMQDAYFELYDRMVVSVDFREGARDVLDFASSCGIAHVILSNHVTEVIAKDLTRLNKLDSFHEILAWPDRETQFSHPKDHFLASYMQRHDLRAEDGIVVGDTTEEVKVARKLGLVSVALSGGYHSLSILEKAKPDYIIHALPDLKPVLQEEGFVS
jgi:phosphoglycolate phosphatase